MGSQISFETGDSYDRKSLYDVRHGLGSQFSPDLEASVLMNLAQTGQFQRAEKYKEHMMIKYKDFPTIYTDLTQVYTKPFAVNDLLALDPMSEFDFDKQLASLSSSSTETV